MTSMTSMPVLALKDKLKHIIEMQIELNDKTYPGWQSANLNWDTAIACEAVEAIDSTPWKWWKSGELDIENLKVEAIDILHFIISAILTNHSNTNDLDKITEDIYEEYVHPYNSVTLERSLKLLIMSAIKQDYYSTLRHLSGVFELLKMNEDEVYSRYMTKNLLNAYRQYNGYKDPDVHYKKIIDNREDNVIFKEIVDSLTEYNLALDELKAKSFELMKEAQNN